AARAARPSGSQDAAAEPDVHARHSTHEADMSWLSDSLDALVYAVSPERGNRRAAARVRHEYASKLRDKLDRKLSTGGFASAEQSQDAHSWMTSRLSPTSALEEGRQVMLERADSAYKNYEIGTNHVEGRVIRVVGCGTQI